MCIDLGKARTWLRSLNATAKCGTIWPCHISPFRISHLPNPPPPPVLEVGLGCSTGRSWRCGSRHKPGSCASKKRNPLEGGGFSGGGASNGHLAMSALGSGSACPTGVIAFCPSCRCLALRWASFDCSGGGGGGRGACQKNRQTQTRGN